MITLSSAVKKSFFDRPKILDALGKRGRETIRALSKAGAWIRQRARSSIRRRKRVSSPGSPPSAHSRDPNVTLKKILFAYDAAAGSVVVGPVGLNVQHVINGKLAPGVVPNVLEFGGTMGIPEVQLADGRWVRLDTRGRRRDANKPARIRQATYRARPFMNPALKAELPNLPSRWANSIRA